MTPTATTRDGGAAPGVERGPPGRHGWDLRTPAAALAAVCAGLLALSGPAVAQQGGGGAADSAAAGAADSVAADSLVDYRREVFSYPGDGRRNPFEPVDAGVQEGPRFSNLRLSGVIYSPSVGSVAVLVDETTGKRYRVRNGERLGDARVVQIDRTEVTFAVSTVGQTRRETLQVEKQQRESQG